MPIINNTCYLFHLFLYYFYLQPIKMIILFYNHPSFLSRDVNKRYAFGYNPVDEILAGGLSIRILSLYICFTLAMLSIFALTSTFNYLQIISQQQCWTSERFLTSRSIFLHSYNIAEVAGSVQTRHRVPRQHGQLKDHTGFLVSRSLTLLAAPPSTAGVI